MRGGNHTPKLLPLLGSNVCTYVNKFVIKHDEGPHGNTSEPRLQGSVVRRTSC